MRKCRLGYRISVLFLVAMLTGLFPGTSTAAAKSDDFRSVDRLSVPRTHIFLPVVLKDPAPIIPVQPSHETFSVDWGGGKIQALGGRMSLDFPQGAVNYPNCTLHVETPDKNASWLEFNFYIFCQVNPGEDPYDFYRFNFPVTISMDYSKDFHGLFGRIPADYLLRAGFQCLGADPRRLKMPECFLPICPSAISWSIRQTKSSPDRPSTRNRCNSRAGTRSPTWRPDRPGPLMSPPLRSFIRPTPPAACPPLST